MTFFDKVKKSAAEAAKVAQQTVEVTKLNAQIAAKEREIERTQTLIGQSVFAAYKAGSPASSGSRSVELCRAIEKIQGEIEWLKQQIKVVKNERECSCGHRIALNTPFCSNCGRQFIVQTITAVTSVNKGDLKVLCSSCRRENERGSQFCISCGDRLEAR